MAKFRTGNFLIAFFTISLLTVISWLFAFAKDEGQINERTEPIKNFIADSFNLFRFPTHLVLEPWILADGIGWYFPALIFNAFVWAISIERLFSIGVKLYDNNKVESNRG